MPEARTEVREKLVTRVSQSHLLSLSPATRPISVLSLRESIGQKDDKMNPPDQKLPKFALAFV